MKSIQKFLWLFFFSLLTGCSSGPEPIAFGKDQCDFCMMTIVDRKYGAELVTKKGRVLKYDAAECLVNHLEKDAPPSRQLWAIAYDDPGTLYPADSLHFVFSPRYKSPMGANLAGFKDLKNQADGDTTLQWKEVKEGLSSK